MKILTMIFAIMILIFNGATFANEEAEGTSCDNANAITASVNGLVCDFCARALEKVFGKREEVEGIKVDLDKGEVVINLKEGQSIDDATITKLITDSGFNVTKLTKGC